MDEVKNLLIPINGGGNIRLSEVADIRLDYLEDQNYIRLNRKNTIGVEIQKRSDANVVKAADAVKAEIPAITESLPSGMKLVVASDNSIFITSSLKGVRDNIAEGIITTALVLYLFLRSWRSSIIILVAIPTSLISTFFIMYVSGFTLNMMSLMALSLCIGILVDDSIVVLENIERHLHMGKSTVEAAIEGRKEIAMAAIAITLCDVVVFAPIAFVSGMTGAIFRQFGLTVVFAALFSLFVSFTITPMLASRVLKRNVKNVGEAASELKKLSKFTVLFTKATEIYKKFLIWSLHHRIKIVAVTVVALILSILLVPMHFIEIEFTPKVDSGTFTIALKLSPGSNLRQTDMKVKYIEQYLESIHDIKDYYTTVGSDRDTASANITVNLRDKKDRAKSQTQIAEEVRTWGKQLAGVEFTVGESSMGEGGSSSAITVDIVGSDINVLRDIAGKVEGIVKSVPGTIDVSNTSKIKGNELLIRIDRLAASNYGVSVSNIAAALHTAIQGSNAGVYRENGEEYDITVKFNNAQVKSAEEIGSIRIANDQNQSVFLNQVASLSNSDTQQSISRKDRQNTVQITANVQGRSVAQITREIAPKLDGLSKPAGYEVKFGGAQADTNTAFVALLKAFLVSIVLLYMILVVLYESFLTPFLRMLSLPVAIIGALCFLALTRNSLNIMSMIGIIMLDGLASKNGTLLIDYTNTLMKRGLPLREALLEAGVTRLRPILMTSATMIVGMLPAALAIGEGAEYKSGMAMVIIGGMIVSTILTPVLIPVVYTLIDDMRNFFSRRKKKNFVTNEVLSDEN
jgi:HAE1 family hydrophobic/amphiphilic exporter-1